jgi:hypothetical protein
MRNEYASPQGVSSREKHNTQLDSVPSFSSGFQG